MIHIHNGAADRQEIPPFLQGLAPESLADLAWVDPELGMVGHSWWPAVDASSSIDASLQKYSGETYTINEADKTVSVHRTVVAIPPEQIAAALASAKAPLIKKIDQDADAIYQAVQGNRGNEYALAESDATAFKAGGYVGAAPASVQAWADAKTATAQWAADDILATATAWRAAMSAIRTNRLRCKELARGATTSGGLEQVQAIWAGFTTAIRGQLGIA
jgi:hypothetical protein